MPSRTEARPLLAAVLLLAAGCAAPAGEPSPAGEPGSGGAPCAPAHYVGVVESVRTSERGVEAILVEADRNATYDRIRFDVDDGTRIEKAQEGGCAPATDADLLRGARVGVDHRDAMTRSDPPMTRALRIVIGPEA